MMVAWKSVAEMGAGVRISTFNRFAGLRVFCCRLIVKARIVLLLLGVGSAA